MGIVYQCDRKGCGASSSEMMHLVRVYEKKDTKQGGKSKGFWICGKCYKELFGGDEDV